MELRDAVAVVTGASSGIGEATARALHGAGARLVLTGRSADKLAALTAELGGDGAARWLAGEVTDPALPGALLDLGLGAFGRADVLVNNAGGMVVGPAESVDIEAACAMVRVNVEAAFRAGYVFARHFKAQNSGFLVQTSSVAGVTNYPGMAAYCGTKHAVESFADCLRAELAGSGVGVACIAPGVVSTNLYRDWSDKEKEVLASAHPLSPADVAEAVLFALSRPPHVNVGRILVTPADEGV